MLVSIWKEGSNRRVQVRIEKNNKDLTSSHGINLFYLKTNLLRRWIISFLKCNQSYSLAMAMAMLKLTTKWSLFYYLFTKTRHSEKWDLFQRGKVPHPLFPVRIQWAIIYLLITSLTILNTHINCIQICKMELTRFSIDFWTRTRAFIFWFFPIFFNLFTLQIEKENLDQLTESNILCQVKLKNNVFPLATDRSSLTFFSCSLSLRDRIEVTLWNNNFPIN